LGGNGVRCLLRANDRLLSRYCCKREFFVKLMGAAAIGCFPNLYKALPGNLPDQVITLPRSRRRNLCRERAVGSKGWRNHKLEVVNA